MKRIFAVLMAVIMTFTMCSFTVSANEEIEVYITVSDITDYTQPINILVERHKMKVGYFNLAEYGDTMNGIQCIEGITYLHALTQLHRNLYGEEGVKDSLLLTTDGVTKIFMGRSVANVMYKNGKDIFSLPQLVNISDGDEIQVCLYDEGHSQAIATFREARIDNIAIDEAVTLKLEQHYGFPRDRDAIPNAEITDETGQYITDENGNIITTDDNGEFTVNYSEAGQYTISAMPLINYYMSDTGGGIKVEWIPQTVLKEVECVTYNKNADTDPEGRALYDAVYGDDENGMIVIFEWDGKHTEPFITISKDIETEEKIVTGYEEVTELVKVETVVPDELEPMVTYTTPLVVLNVTDDLIFDEVYLNGYNMQISAKNEGYHQNLDLWVAGYMITDSGQEVFKEAYKIDNVKSDNTVKFSGLYDRYKIMCWYDGTMTPAYEVYTFEPNTAAVTSLEYDYTMPLPENTYITSKH